MSKLIILLSLLFLVSCSETEIPKKVRCLKYQKLGNEVFSVEVKNHKDFQYLELCSRIEGNVEIRTVWQFRGETTKRILNINKGQCEPIMMNHQLGVYVTHKTIRQYFNTYYNVSHKCLEEK